MPSHSHWKAALASPWPSEPLLSGPSSLVSVTTGRYVQGASNIALLPRVPFPSEPIPSYSCLFDLSIRALLALQAQLVTSSGKSSLMLPRAMPKSVAWCPFPGGTLFMCVVIPDACPISSLHLG